MELLFYFFMYLYFRNNPLHKTVMYSSISALGGTDKSYNILFLLHILDRFGWATIFIYI